MKNITTSLINLSDRLPGQVVIALESGFEFISTEANAHSQPTELVHLPNFKPATVPGTVAMHIENPALLTALDAKDHWYRTTFTAPQQPYQKLYLQFDGLLTVVEVYLNGASILQSSNAFHMHQVEISQGIQATNQLYICFRAIKPIYTQKQPRAKYMTRLVSERHLRFIRTPVLGYTPGFAASTKHVGPYRSIKLVLQNHLAIDRAAINASLIGTDTGIINAEILLQCFNDSLQSASLQLLDDSQTVIATQPLSLEAQAENFILSGQLQANNIAAYWPHTYGKPQRYSLNLIVETAQQSHTIALGHYGFRRIERQKDPSFNLQFNGANLFFRGACWTPMNPTSLLVKRPQLEKRLNLLRDAGINMLRIPGNMLYESDDFYELCDALGILVFQDFAFSNFDYPLTEPFIASVEKEVQDFLNKHGARPCLTVLCGGSEVAQQAAMMGVALPQINHALFTQVLPALTAQYAPDIPYVVSSPYANEGLPFHVGDGALSFGGKAAQVNTELPAHMGGPAQYFGVGGYRRSFEDARLFKGRFITECLPFSHVPEERSLLAFWNGEIHPIHHPLWKEGVCRDVGSSWDFSDITDFYLEKLFNISSSQLRSVDFQRYLDYCRATVVEAVETVLSIFRADSAQGRAALVWNLHDLKPGAGWGYIDILGRPKSAFYAFARSAQPTTVLLIDEGLEGLAIYIAHDGAQAMTCQLKLALITIEGGLFAQSDREITLDARSVTRYSVDTLIGRFVDSSYAYRFGPPAFSSCIAQLFDGQNNLISQKVYTQATETHQLTSHIGLTAEAVEQTSGEYLITLATQLPAFYVHIDLADFQLSDNYFHVLPGFPTVVKATALNKTIEPNNTPALQGRVRALNTRASFAIHIN